MLNERRKFMRFDVSLDVAFKAPKESEKHVTGVTRNFSRSGLCFESRTFGTALNSIMELEVKLPDQDTFISVLGNVAWKERLADKYLVGIDLIEIDKDAKGQILDYAYELWVEETRAKETKSKST